MTYLPPTLHSFPSPVDQIIVLSLHYPWYNSLSPIPTLICSKHLLDHRRSSTSYSWMDKRSLIDSNLGRFLERREIETFANIRLLLISFVWLILMTFLIEIVTRIWQFLFYNHQSPPDRTGSILCPRWKQRSPRQNQRTVLMLKEGALVRMKVFRANKSKIVCYFIGGQEASRRE